MVFNNTKGLEIIMTSRHIIIISLHDSRAKDRRRLYYYLYHDPCPLLIRARAGYDVRRRFQEACQYENLANWL